METCASVRWFLTVCGWTLTNVSLKGLLGINMRKSEKRVSNMAGAKSSDSENETTNNAIRVIISSALTGWLSRGLSVAASLITVPIVVSKLGKDGYGVWSLIGASIGFLALTNFGAANSVGRFVARARGVKDEQTLKALLSTVSGLMMAMSVLVTVLTLALSLWVPGWLGLGIRYETAGRWVFLISGMTLALQFPLQIGAGVLQGYQHYGVVNSMEIIKTVLNMSGVLLLLAFDRIRLVPLALVVSIATLVQYTILTFVAWRITGYLRLGLRSVSFALAKEILSLSLSSFLITLSSLAYRSGLTLIVGNVLGIAQAGVYGVVLVVMTHLSSVLTQITRSMVTLASELYAQGEVQRLKDLANFVMRITFALGTTIAIGLVFYGEPILRLLLSKSDWTDANFSSSKTALSIMGFGLALGAPQLSSRSILQGVGKHWPAAFGFLFASISALLVGGIAMARGAGLVGAAVGWGLVMVIQGVIIYPPMVCRFLGQSPWRMLIKVYLPGVLVGMGVWMTSGAISAWFPPTHASSLVVNVLCCLVIGLVATITVSGHVTNLHMVFQSNTGL